MDNNNNNNKKVDGIRRLEGEELRRSREVVLNSIKEEMEKQAAKEKENKKILKRVDGIFHAKKEVKPKVVPAATPKTINQVPLKPVEKSVSAFVPKIEKSPEIKNEVVKPDKIKQKIWQKEMSGFLSAVEKAPEEIQKEEQKRVQKNTKELEKEVAKQKNLEEKRQKELKLREEREIREIAVRQHEFEKQQAKEESIRRENEAKKKRLEEKKLAEEAKQKQKEEQKAAEAQKKAEKEEAKRLAKEEQKRKIIEEQKRRAEERLAEEERKHTQEEEERKAREEKQRRKEEERRLLEEKKLRQEEEKLKYQKELAEKKERIRQERMRLEAEAELKKEQEKQKCLEEKKQKKAEKIRRKELEREEKIRLAQMSKEERKRAEELKKQEEEERRQQIRQQKEEQERLAQEAAWRRAEEKKRLIAEKKAIAEREQRLRRAQLEKKSQEKAELKRMRALERKRKIEAWKKHWHIKKIVWKKFALISIKKIIITGLILTIIGLAIYSIFVFLVIKLGIDNKVSRYLTQIMPVPAMMTKSGMVGYYQYEDLKVARFLEGNMTRAEAEQAVKLDLVRELIINDLAKKHHIKNSNRSELFSQVAEKMAYDEDVNKVALSRIRRIKGMIDAGETFSAAANYGDEQGKVDITNKNAELYSYGARVKDLGLHEVSDIIVTREGYYIFRAQAKASDRLSLSYVFVRAEDLNTYVENLAGNYRLWSLVD